MNKRVAVAVLAGALCVWVNTLKADLLGVNPGYPNITYVSLQSDAVSYDPVGQVFTVNAQPTGITFSPLDSAILIGDSPSIQITVDNAGGLISGANGFTLTGSFTGVVGGVTVSYTGLLLQGNVTAFGSSASGVTSAYDFRVQVTGGQLAAYFGCGDVAISLTSENSTFTGDFSQAFSGEAKGDLGLEDLVPPMIICPPLSAIKFTAATDANGVAGYVLTYPDPVVTDNCDPNPTIFCDTPSGTFLYLDVGDGVTVNCYGIDASGNYSQCFFTAIVPSPTIVPTPIMFTGSPCAPVTLPTDHGLCAATYTFSLPVASDTSGNLFVATASAVDQNGSVIPLTLLPNGQVTGVFPRTTTGTNVITFTASNGQGSTAVRQCLVLVMDVQPPTLLCVNQTSTFKPIITNALSCIQSTFNCVKLCSNSTLWFSSALDTPSTCQTPYTVHVFDQTITLTVNGTNFLIPVPDAYVSFSNGVAVATTTFANGQWTTVSKPNLDGNTFLSGVGFKVPFDIAGCPQGTRVSQRCLYTKTSAQVSASWSARFSVSNPNISVSWAFAAADYTRFSTDYTQLGIKPIDPNHGSACNNFDDAGSPESFKNFVVDGALGDGSQACGAYHCGDDGRWSCNSDQYTGYFTSMKRANLGFGALCMGAISFVNPVAMDNCGNPVKVVCVPPSGSILGPGNHVIMATATDGSGNTNTCSFTLTVLSPLQVVFDCALLDDGICDNTSQPDKGFNDMNCPDDPSTTELVNRFSVGDTLCHRVRILDCNGNDVTCSLASCIRVHVDVTERQGCFSSSTFVCDVPQNYVGTGSPGSLMVPCNGEFQYNLDTHGFEKGTANNGRFFRSCVWVDYNSSPGIPVGMEDVILESR